MSSIRLKVTELGPKGDGVAQLSKGPVFIDRAAPGDEITAKIFRDPKGVSRGELIELVTPSPFRVAPPCPHYNVCGNCTLQHVSDEFYRAWKEELVKTAFLKWNLKPKQWLPPVFLPGKNRRRATFSFTKKKGRWAMGYYQRRSKIISPIPSCEVSLPELMDLKNLLEPMLSSWVKEGTVLDIFLQKIGDSFELIFSGIAALPGAVLRDLSQVPAIGRVALKSEKGIQVLFQEKELTVKFGTLKVSLPPGSFLQPTQAGETALVTAVSSGARTGASFADLFSGAGTFSGPLLSLGPVTAYESNPHAVRALQSAGKFKKIEAIRRDLFSNPLSRHEISKFDGVVFDPPRAGCLEQAKEMARSHCPLLIGVSCNPATFARDAHWLSRGGYQLQTLQVFDQFLWSHHVEMVGVFTKPRS